MILQNVHSSSKYLIVYILINLDNHINKISNTINKSHETRSAQSQNYMPKSPGRSSLHYSG